MDNYKILIIEDEEKIRDSLQEMLQENGYNVTAAIDGQDGLKKFTNDMDVVILDVMMPGVSGYDVCRKLRDISTVPILFLTAKSQVEDEIEGLSIGGDDYIVKPFTFADLNARLHAVIRRHQIYDNRSHLGCLVSGELKVDQEKCQVWKNGNEVELTDTEYHLLVYMMKNKEKIISTPLLYEEVWKEKYLSSANNTVMVHMRRLRKKVEDDPNHPRYLLTVWGKGYRFADRAEK